MPRKYQCRHVHQETLREVRHQHPLTTKETLAFRCIIQLTVCLCASQADTSLWGAPESRGSGIQNPRIPHASETQRDKREEATSKRKKTGTQSQGEEDYNPCHFSLYCKWQRGFWNGQIVHFIVFSNHAVTKYCLLHSDGLLHVSEVSKTVKP